MSEKVILVDEHDQELGLMEKMEAHRKGLLHRAFSIFVLNSRGELLLQQRAFSKYHSGGLWTNTCCSHPRKEEKTIEAAHRRLQEEMGFDCELNYVLEFTYQAALDKNMKEHEYDHVFTGTYDKNPTLNPQEAHDFKWLSLDTIKEDIKLRPAEYTEWFKIIFDRFSKHIKK